ncbi:methyltransferase domain-containing protein [Thermodesulfobacteriota bacterium]
MNIIDPVPETSVHIHYRSSGIGQYDHRFREKALIRVVQLTFSGREPAGVKILDMGCGRGELLALMKDRGFEVTGMDLDPNCVRMAGRHARTLQGDYGSLQAAFEPGAFEMVISSHSLEHLENPRDDLIRLASVSRRFVLLAVPNPLALPNVMYAGLMRKIPDVNQGHLYVWDHRHLKNFLENHAGLIIRSWHGDFVRLFPRKKGIRKVLMGTGIVGCLEVLAGRVFPFLCDSIIALCEKKESQTG